MHSTTLLQHSKELSLALDELEYPSTVCVYNVFNYAWEGWKAYVSNFAHTTKQQRKYLLLGINPGPHGMVQTGIPFGNISAVTRYLQLQYTVKQPVHMHTKRPVQGLQYHREEKSGEKVWGCIQRLFPSPQDFFAQAFVLNFCPLAFFNKKTASNLTPDHTLLRKDKSIKEVEIVCKEHLRNYCNILGITTILAIGRYSHTIAQSLLNVLNINELHYIPHPSPLNPKHTEFESTLNSYFQ